MAFKRWASFQKTALARSDIFNQVKNTLVRSDIFDRGSYPKYFTTPRAIDNHVDNRLKALCVANKHRSARLIKTSEGYEIIRKKERHHGT